MSLEGVATNWQDFQLLDAGAGEKLERWGSYILQRPDPQAVWPHPTWPQADAQYQRSHQGGGQWLANRLPNHWTIDYPSLAGKLTFQISLMGFKHTGLFPEQAVNWDAQQALIIKAKQQKPSRPIRVLNLFAYSGAATMACAAAGADEVVHVDASKKMIALAKTNASLSGLQDRYIRYITEDVNRFVERERRRGRQYEGIIMDPPAYGRGPSGELWKLEEAIFPLVSLCTDLLSDDPLFFFINAYTTGLTARALTSILTLGPGRKFPKSRTEGLELGLPAQNRPLILPCGCTGRWQPC